MPRWKRWVDRFREAGRRITGVAQRNVSLGTQGERVAEHYLRGQGWRILARGRQTRFSELDLVGLDGRTVVFVEVKCRRSDRRGSPLEAVDLGKQRRLTAAALAYLKKHRLLEQAARFDVVAITCPSDDVPPHIQHVKDAFAPVGHGQFFS